MGKSFKKNAVSKIKGTKKDNYWGHVRSKTKTILRSKHYSEINEDILPDPKEIINDYDYTELTIHHDEEDKFKRK